MRRPRSLTIAGVLAMSACTYGPPQHRIQIQQAEGRPETRTFAAIVWSEVRREATGLAAFPDGGVPRIRDQSVTIYVADVDQRAVRRVGQIRIPPEMENSRQPFLPGWKGSSFYVQLSGCPNPHAECNDKILRRAAYRVDEDGTMTRVDTVPRPLEREPGMGARAPGERVYMRISATGDTVFVRTEDGGPFVPLFMLNRDGELVPTGMTP
jgi:hypothetical protein